MSASPRYLPFAPTAKSAKLRKSPNEPVASWRGTEVQTRDAPVEYFPSLSLQANGNHV